MRETLEGGFDFSGGADGDDTRLHPKRWRGGLDRLHEKSGLRRCVWIEHDADVGKPRRNLLKEVEPFIADRELVHAEAGEIAARPRHIGNEKTRGPDNRRVITIGERYKILPGTAHCISTGIELCGAVPYSSGAGVDPNRETGCHRIRISESSYIGLCAAIMY